MHINLFDDSKIRDQLLPLTFTRPVASIRLGILTISEKWNHFGYSCGFDTQDYLKKKYLSLDTLLRANGALIPTKKLVTKISQLQRGQALVKNNILLAVNGNVDSQIEYEEEVVLIKNSWDIFKNNRAQIEADFSLITNGRKSQEISDPHTVVYGKENVFIEEGATIRAIIINAENGPVYIGKNASVHEGSIISGAFALCENAHLNMGAKRKGDTTIGPYCKVGGEVSNSVIFGYSNTVFNNF